MDPIIASGMDENQARAALNDTLGRHGAVLQTLEAQGRATADKLQAIDQMLPEFRAAIATVREGQMGVAMAGESVGPESELRRFIRPDGSVRMLGEKRHGEVYRDGLLDAGESHGWWHRDLKQLYTLRSIVRTRSASGASPMVDQMLEDHKRMAPPLLARIFGATGTGAEWIPTENMVPDIDHAVGVMSEGRIASLFAVTPMSTEVVTVPFGSTGGTPYLQGEPVSDPAMFTATMPTTANRTHTAKTLALRYEIDNNSAEDAIIDAYSELSMLIASDLVDGEEDAIINGDTAATHQDTGLASWNPNGRWSASTFGGSADHRRAWIGLRARAFDVSNTVDSNSAQTYDGAMVVRGMLQARSGGAAFIANEKYLYTKMMTFSQLQLTTSAVGQVQDGRIVNVGGVPLYLSFFLTNDKAATGLYTGSGTYTELLCADLSRFRRYVRRGSQVELQRDASRGVTQMVSTWRGTFKTNDSATAKNVSLGFKLLA